MAETSEVFRVGLLGHGTVGGAFASLLTDRADAVAATVGLRPEISGVLTRSGGDFDEILAGSDLIVELIGGIEPARSSSSRANAAPTVPWPSRPTRNVSDVSAMQLLVGLAAHHHA